MSALSIVHGFALLISYFFLTITCVFLIVDGFVFPKSKQKSDFQKLATKIWEFSFIGFCLSSIILFILKRIL